MRIAVLATGRNAIRQPYAGGQESQTGTLIRALRERDHHIRLFAPEGSDPTQADEFVPYQELPEMTAVARAATAPLELPYLQDHARFYAAVLDLLGSDDLDVIHNQSLNHLPLVMSSALPAPVVTTLHTPPIPWLELGMSLAGPTSSYVAVSHSTARLWPAPVAPTVVHNGIDPEEFSGGPGGDHLLWVGRLTPEKGTDLAIDAAEAAGMDLVLAGPISNAEWFDAVIKPRLQGPIRYAGHLAHSELDKTYGESAALLFTPQWDEPFGLVAVEAAMTGTPVIALNRGGLAEVVGSGLGVLVDHLPAAGLAERLAAAVPEALAISRESVRQNAIEHFGAARMAEDYLRVFAAVA